MVFGEGKEDDGNFAPCKFEECSKNVYIYIYVGVSENSGTPKTPQNDHF